MIEIDWLLNLRKDRIRSIENSQRIDSQNGVEETNRVHLNGITHVINIRGKDKNNPVILHLHGGPGVAEMPFAYRHFRTWEDKFTLVQWDQRGAGATLCANPDYDPTMATFEDFLKDTEEVIQYLQKKLDKEKIIILGYSWGSVLGIHLLRSHPEWVSAYVGTGQSVYAWEQESEGFKFALREAYARNDLLGIKALEAIKPYPDEQGIKDKILIQRLYIKRYGGSLFGRDDYSDGIFTAIFESPDYSAADWECWFKSKTCLQHVKLIEKQYAKNSEFGNLPALGLNFSVPIFFFLGVHDEQVSMRKGAEYFESIDAPLKRLVLFRKSGHAPHKEESEAFLDALVEHVRPLTM